MKCNYLLKLCVPLLAVLLLFSSAGLAQDMPVGVLIAQEIGPFVEMVEGFEAALGNRQVQRFFLDKNGQPYSLAGRGTVFQPTKYAALVAVGPEALRYLQTHAGQVPVVFGMILNPQRFYSSEERTACGVSLNIPVNRQFEIIRANLPEVSRLGVLFDPANNQDWFDQAEAAAAQKDLELVPLEVEQKEGRLHIMEDVTQQDAILFIPDKTVIFRSFIQYVIKQALVQQVPVIGYNRFFLDSGSALSFVIDYRGIGRQVADQVQGILTGRPCSRILPPDFDTEINQDVYKALDLASPGGNHE